MAMALQVDPGSLSFHRQLGSAAEVEIPFDVVARAARVCLAEVVSDALGVTTRRGQETVASTRRGARLFRVTVDADVSSARPRSGEIGHLRWHARRFPRVFPELEASVVARPLEGGRTELLLGATYRPPGGLLGIVGDAILGRPVARSTLETFTRRLARSMEDHVRDGHCGPWTGAGPSGDAA